MSNPGPRVLIVDDEAGIRRFLRASLEAHGYSIDEASTGEEALHLAHKFQPQAITLDLNLPGLHGWSVLDRLKHDPRTRHIPVQVISVFDERDFSLELGAIGYLKKPIDHEGLMNTFKDLRAFIEKTTRAILIVEDDERQRKADQWRVVPVDQGGERALVAGP